MQPNTKPGKERIELTELKAIKDSLKLGPVYCTIAQPSAVGIPVRDVRRFRADHSLRQVDIRDPKWTELASLGHAIGYEVLTLEGWHVPEKVWREVNVKC